MGIDIFECIAGITLSYWAHDQDVSMAGNNPNIVAWHMADKNPPMPQDQDKEQDVTMEDAKGCSSTPRTRQSTRPRAAVQLRSLGPRPTGRAAAGRPHRSKPDARGHPPVIKRQECKHRLKRLGFSLDPAEAIVCHHGYNTAKKLSCLKSDNVDILIKKPALPRWRAQRQKQVTQNKHAALCTTWPDLCVLHSVPPSLLQFKPYDQHNQLPECL